METRKRWSPLHIAASVLMLTLLLAVFAPMQVAAQDRTEEGASIRFVHASPDGAAVDVIADGAVVAENVAFGSATDYLPMTSDKHQVQVVPTGSTAESALLDEEIDLDSGGAYIFAVAGLLNDLQAKLYQVDLDDLDENQARVRLIHLAPDEDNLDLAVAGGDEWHDDVDFPNASGYKDVDAGAYNLDARQHDSDTIVASVTGVTIRPDRAYDFLVIGQASAQNLSMLILETRISPSCGDVLGLGSDDDACARIVNASPDAAAIDVYVNDTLFVEGLAFGESTEFTALPSNDDSSLKVTAAGASIDSPILEDDIDLDAGQGYDIILLNDADDLELTSTEVDLSPVPADQARLRVIGASSDAPDLNVEITDGPELFDGIGFKDASDTTVVDASTYDLQFKDGDNVVTRLEGFEVAANTFYDLIVIGSADANTLQVIALSAPTANIEGDSATPAGTPEATGDGLAGTATPDAVSTPSP